MITAIWICPLHKYIVPAGTANPIDEYGDRLCPECKSICHSEKFDWIKRSLWERFIRYTCN